MLSSRGVVLATGAAGAAVAGLLYGVEEFVLLALAVGVLLVVGVATLWYRTRLARRSLRVVVRVPVAELASGQSALVEMLVCNEGRRRLPPIVVEEPRRHWTVTHPGLGGGPSPGAPGRTVPDGPGRSGSTPPAPGLLDVRPGPGRRHTGTLRRLVGRSFRLPDLPPGADAALWIPVPTSTRGLLTLHRVGLWCEDPLRLFARRVAVAPPAHAVVHPVPADAGRPPSAASRPGARPAPGSRPPTQAVSGDELSGLRPYAPGDRLTRLHWPALARAGELMVREFVEPDAGSLMLLVDLRPGVHAGASIDDVVATAAGLGLDALGSGATVELCTSTGDRVSIAPNAAGRHTLLRALALLGPADPLPAVARRWGARPTDGAVWATGRVDGGTISLVTTTIGATTPALPPSLRHRVETVVAREASTASAATPAAAATP